MKLLDLNTHSWIEDDPMTKLEQLVEFILEGDYDVITLQEVNQLMSASLWKGDEFFCSVPGQRSIKDDNFAKVVVDRLRERGVTYYWSWADAHIGYDKYDEGVALLSKHPITAKSAWVSRTQDRTDYHTRVVLVGTTMIEGREVCVASGHFSWWEDFQYEWEQTEALLAGYGDMPRIVMGDFNNPAEVRGEGYDLVASNRLGLVDAYTVAERRVGEHTVAKAIDGWEGNAQLLRIDLAWVTPELAVAEYRVVCDGVNGPVVSDHYGFELTVNDVK